MSKSNTYQDGLYCDICGHHRAKPIRIRKEKVNACPTCAHSIAHGGDGSPIPNPGERGYKNITTEEQ